jgi:hypothetical protein
MAARDLRLPANVAGTNGSALAPVKASMPPTPVPSPILILTVGHSVFRTPVKTAHDEGIDVNTLATGLLLLGMGKQSVVARQKRLVPDDAPDTEVGVICLACGRSRRDPRDRRCPTCHGSWTSAIR